MSIWGNILDRATGEAIRKEDLEEEFKKKLETATREYIEKYVNLMFQYGCTVEEIKHCYKIALREMGDFCIVDSLDEESQDLYWEKNEEWKLYSCINNAIRHYGEEIFSNLQDGDVRVTKKESTKPIDYPMLRVVLKHQVERLIKNNTAIPDNIDIVDDLYSRTHKLFEYVNKEISNDSELNKLLYEKNVDGAIERLVFLISKHDGTNIPVPYEDIDDWWGDFNGTINYLVWAYK